MAHLLKLQDGDQDLVDQLWDVAICAEEIRVFYQCLVEAVYLLKDIDLGNTGAKFRKYQKIFPDLIMESYGKDQNLSKSFSYDSTEGAGTIRYDRIRKAALDVLLDEIIAKNNDTGLINYDFESEEAENIICDMLSKVEKSHEEEFLKETKKMFRRIKSKAVESAIEDASRTLIDHVESNPLKDISDMRRLETRIKRISEKEENDCCAIVAEPVKGINNYLLLIDDRVEDVSPKPYFSKKFVREKKRQERGFRNFIAKANLMGTMSWYASAPDRKLWKRAY